jgi:hypothetical protein
MKTLIGGRADQIVNTVTLVEDSREKSNEDCGLWGESSGKRVLSSGNRVMRGGRA